MSENSNNTYNNEFNSLYNGIKDDKDKNDKKSNDSNIFGDDEDNHDHNNNNNNNNNNNDDITPSILLEQLAYVDNFMLNNSNQDFRDIDTWILNENNNSNNNNSENDSTTNKNNNSDIKPLTTNGIFDSNNNSNISHDLNSFLVDEQLAAELSAFTDTNFMFPDEDKSNLPNNSDDDNESENDQNNNNNNNNNNTFNNIDDNQNDSNNNDKKKSSHYLSQRKNTFLTSQYDHSKSRFSSRRNKLSNSNNNNNNDNNSPSDNNNTNIEISTFSSEGNSPITQQSRQTNIINNTNRSNSIRSSFDLHNPSVPSPLSLIKSINENKQPTSNKNNNNSNNNNNKAPIPNTTVSTPKIQMPDYSKISTESLVALLPRVTIPKSVNNMLIKAGFSKDQIIALSAIMAHYEQQKLNGNINTNNDNITNDNNNTEILAKLNKLNDSNPVKLSSMILVGLMDNIELENKIKSSNDSTNNNNISNNNNKPSSKDEILSLIEAGNKEVNELKNKLDKKIIRTQKLKEEMNNMVDDSNISYSNINNGNNSIDDKNSRKRSFIETESDNQETEELSTDNNSSSTHSKSTTIKTTQRKKIKEKELENTIQELRSLASSLESKIDTLQLENRLLKDLVVNSGEQEGIEKAEHIKQNLLKKFNKD